MQQQREIEIGDTIIFDSWSHSKGWVTRKGRVYHKATETTWEVAGRFGTLWINAIACNARKEGTTQ